MGGSLLAASRFGAKIADDIWCFVVQLGSALARRFTPYSVALYRLPHASGAMGADDTWVRCSLAQPVLASHAFYVALHRLPHASSAMSADDIWFWCSLAHPWLASHVSVLLCAGCLTLWCDRCAEDDIGYLSPAWLRPCSPLTFSMPIVPAAVRFYLARWVPVIAGDIFGVGPRLGSALARPSPLTLVHATLYRLAASCFGTIGADGFQCWVRLGSPLVRLSRFLELLCTGYLTLWRDGRR